jgi:hypothetical protein
VIITIAVRKQDACHFVGSWRSANQVRSSTSLAVILVVRKWYFERGSNSERKMPAGKYLLTIMTPLVFAGR